MGSSREGPAQCPERLVVSLGVGGTLDVLIIMTTSSSSMTG